MTLKKNGNYNKPFYYNMSGLIVEHGGMIVVRDVEKSVVNSLYSERTGANNGMITLQIDPNYSFFLAPSYIIAEVRENSPGAMAGLRKGDEILKINGKDAYKFKLHEIIALYSSKTGKVISMDISRNGIKSKIKFTLEKVL
jgi:C-terminal processing protease CtpA/Prc